MLRQADRPHHRLESDPKRRGQTEATTSAGIGPGLALATRWAKLLGGKLELVPDRPAAPHQPGACFRRSLAPLPESSLG